MTNDGNNTLVYDAENRLLSATNGSTSGTYTYDGNSLRIKKVIGSTTTVYIFSGSKVVAEYDNGAAVGSPSREYIYSGSKLLAKIDSSGTKYYHQDHLSNRVVTDSSGNSVAQLGHYPFGESWYNASNDKLVFTSYERDSESGNDYAMMRFHINRLARLSSPDPLGGTVGNPQSLNHYIYSRNDPMNLSDPTGLTPRMYACGGGGDPFNINGCIPWGYLQAGGGGADGGGGIAISGNDIFDAIMGAPGTYMTPDAYGNLTWGFSADRWHDYYASQTTVEYKFTGIDNPSIEEQQKQLAAIELGKAACAGQDPSAVAGCIQDAYDTMGDAVAFDGGNYNFSYLDVVIQGKPLELEDLADCVGGRCGDIDSLHFHTTQGKTDFGTFHVDTANPFGMLGVGGLIHLTFDVIGGHAWWNGGIPRPWWK